ncbi:hypothetical protein AK830_g7266 [Neonectria ditissima]|uniref:t-SNARE coiled-coil homology domain-containing protein n=1 Tax=Neonectria ditissima TaxID=78410 RepID=A0A0N8H6L6_9HYPO|nr:hypothetical protein AK830_g7266 [Neonectria ditissima]
MANPLDTDAGSELFGSYEAEFELVEADLTQKLDQIPDLSGEPRKAAISQAERALEEADELLGQMRLEKQNIPTSSRTEVNKRFRSYESDTEDARQKLISLSSDQAALFGSRYTDNPTGPSDVYKQHATQRDQLNRGTQRLQDGSQSLMRTTRLANETLEIGASTAAQLYQQRHQIEGTGRNLESADGTLDHSIKKLSEMARRSRISLISKSDIRYVGTLHEINSDESTVSLENVRSFGTEGRKGRPEEEIAASEQVYEYIVFRGSDVKDLRIEDHPSIKENKPPAVPDDPAIVGARARPVAQASNQNAPPPGAPPFAPYPPNNFYGGPPPGSWGRGGAPGPGPGPGPNFANMPYPPPPGWFPPGQGFPPGGPPGGSGGPAPWNYPYPPGPGGPGAPDVAQNQRAAPTSAPPQDSKPAPIGPGADRGKATGPSGQAAPPTEPKSLAQGPRQSSHAPTPPVDSKPSVEEVKQAVAGHAQGQAADAKLAPSGPRNHRITPVIPLSGPVAKPFHLPGVSDTTAKPAVTTTPGNVQDATNAARAAVAVAMAQLGNPGSNAMDNLTKKVNEMRVNAVGGAPANRGRGRGGRSAITKVEVPDSDFDFAGANAKFNKQDLVKEAIAGSPVTETTGEAFETSEPATSSDIPVAYNKTTSFFDNISSEAKDRSENGGQKPGGREWRGEEQRKNMETFGQGSVDGGYRNFRGRGRGRGRGGRGGFSRGGGRGGNRPQYQTTPAAQ